MIAVLADCCCLVEPLPLPSQHYYNMVVYDVSYWDDYFTYFDGSSVHISNTVPPKYRFVGTRFYYYPNQAYHCLMYHNGVVMDPFGCEVAYFEQFKIEFKQSTLNNYPDATFNF